MSRATDAGLPPQLIGFGLGSLFVFISWLFPVCFLGIIALLTRPPKK